MMKIAEKRNTSVFTSLTSSPRFVWCLRGTRPRRYSPSSSLTLLTSGRREIYQLRLDTLAVKLPRVLADPVFSGKSLQSSMVFGRNGDCLYWVRHSIKESCCEWPLPWKAKNGISFDLSTLTSLWSSLWIIGSRASFLRCWRKGQPRR